MISLMGIGLSALRAFGQKMAITAENIANFESEGYVKKSAVIKEALQGGVVVDITSSAPPGKQVELSEEIPQEIVTQRAYEANLQSIKTEDEMLGTLIDIIE